MPFDFRNPKGLQEPDRKYRVSMHTLERRWPTDRYDLTGGSFPVRPDKCSNLCPKRTPIHDYSSYFLKTRTMYQNPGVLVGLRNTPVLERVLKKPHIHFTSPKFTHKEPRSTSHLRIPNRYKTAVCKITDNLRQRAEKTYAFKAKKRKEDQIAAAAEKIDMEHALLELGGRFSHHHQVLGDHVSGNKIFDDSPKQKKDSLLDVCKKGTLLEHVRKHVHEDLQNQESEERKRQLCFASASQIPFEIHQYKRNSQAPPAERYAYDPDAGMAMMCDKKNILAKFFESPSDRKLHHREFNEPDSIEDIGYELPPYPGFRRHQYTPSLVQLITKAPKQKQEEAKKKFRRSDHSEYSHLGLIEAGKKEVMGKVIGKLRRRARDVTIPPELSQSIYGVFKDVPGIKASDVTIPFHLTHDVPASNEEIKKVETAILHNKAAEKLRRMRGIQSDGDAEYSVFQRFTKALLSSEDEQSDVSDPEEQKRAAREEEILEDMCKELHRIQDDIRATARRSEPTFYASDLLPASSHKTCSLPPIHTKPSRLVRKTKLLETFSSSSEDHEEAESEEEYLDPNLVIRDYSSDDVQYSDVAYSDIDITEADVPTLRENQFYKMIASEVAKSSSSGESTHEDDSDMSVMLSKWMEEFGLSSPEEEEEEEEEEEMEAYADDEFGEFRLILESILLNASEMIDAPSKEMNAIRSTVYVEKSKTKHKYLPEPGADPRDTHYAFWEKVFETKMVREVERQKRLDAAKDRLKTFDTYHGGEAR